MTVKSNLCEELKITAEEFDFLMKKILQGKEDINPLLLLKLTQLITSAKAIFAEDLQKKRDDKIKKEEAKRLAEEAFKQQQINRLRDLEEKRKRGLYPSDNIWDVPIDDWDLNNIWKIRMNEAVERRRVEDDRRRQEITAEDIIRIFRNIPNSGE